MTEKIWCPVCGNRFGGEVEPEHNSIKCPHCDTTVYPPLKKNKWLQKREIDRENMRNLHGDNTK